MLGAPVVGIGLSSLIVGEAVDSKLALSALMILAGVAVGMRMPALGTPVVTNKISGEKTGSADLA